MITYIGKYWNNTLRSLCPVLDDSEGITLRSLGGVFIATLVGLTIAMFVLIVEVTFDLGMICEHAILHIFGYATFNLV